MSAERDDAAVVGQAGAVSKLYTLAMLDEVTTAVTQLQIRLAEIRRKYMAELSAGPEQFALLTQMPELDLPAPAPVHSDTEEN